jgi:hypothetical protein
MSQIVVPFKNEDFKPIVLAETESTKKSRAKSNPFVTFIFGCLLIPFSLVLLWKNEKKLVTFAKCMEQA